MRRTSTDAWLAACLSLVVCAAAAASTGPASSQPVAGPTFDAILAELNARPSIAPRFSRVAARSRSAAERACGLDPHTVAFSVPKPRPAVPGRTSQFDLAIERMRALVSGGLAARGAVLAVVRDLAVNTDASPRSYHPLDPHGLCTGEGPGRVCALNALCNAGVRLFDGPAEIKCSARDAYRTAWGEMWRAISERQALAIPQAFWLRDRTGGSASRYGFFHAEKPMTVVFRETIIARNSAYGPCVRDAEGARYKGYFVTKTSILGDEGPDEAEGSSLFSIVYDRRCDPRPYANSETLPNIVIPLGGWAGARVGDLALGHRRDAAGVERLVYAVVGDEGPNHRFGEGSIAFNAALKGVDKSFESYGDVARELHIGSTASPGERVGLLIFKGTSGLLGGRLDRRSVAEAAEMAFTAWGGGALDKARERLAACLDLLP